MSAPQVGDKISEDVVFSYVKPTDSEITACGIPINYDAGKGKRHLDSTSYPSAFYHPYCTDMELFIGNMGC